MVVADHVCDVEVPALAESLAVMASAQRGNPSQHLRRKLEQDEVLNVERLYVVTQLIVRDLALAAVRLRSN